MNFTNWQQLAVYLAVLLVSAVLAALHIIDAGYVLVVISAILGGNLFAHGLTSGGTVPTPAVPAPTTPAAAPPVVG